MMPAWLATSDVPSAVDPAVAWMVTSVLLLVGMVGCVLPWLPGHALIFLAAVAHRLMLGAEASGLEWWSFVVLGALALVSQVLEFIGGAAGAKGFGGSRWGALGAVVGAGVGLFMMPIGLLLGPLIGAFAFEIAFARKELQTALMSGFGSVAGALVAMVIKMLIGGLMLVWFLADVFWIG
jgi:uncharacterized protein YqgC (DUF456 family)